MKRPLRQSINKSVWILTVILVIVLFITFLIVRKNNIKLEPQVNLSDILSNILNVIALYTTVFFVLKLTSEISDKTKEIDLEKSLAIERIKSLYERVEKFHEIIDTGVIGFQDTIRELDRIERAHSSIINIISSPDSAAEIDPTYIAEHRRAFDSNLENCRTVLTYTPPRSTSDLAYHPLVTIVDNAINVSSDGIQSPSLYLQGIKTNFDDLMRVVNQS